MSAMKPAASANSVPAVSLARLLVIAAALFAAPFGQAGTARLTVDLVGDPWPPYVEGEPGEYATGGVAVEIIRRVFDEIGDAEVRFPLIPWKRALLEVERGSTDGIPMLLKTPEREAYMQFSAPLVTGYNLVWSVVRDGAVYEWSRIEDLHGKTLGVVKGYSYGADIDGAIAAGRIAALEAPNVEQLFAMLEAGRIELVLANDAVGYALTRQQRAVEIKPSQRPANAETFHIGLSKKSPAVGLLPQIDRAIDRLRRQGVIERIVQRGSAD